MKRKDIEIGETYACKVSGLLVPVKVLADRGASFMTTDCTWNPGYKLKHRGFDAMNLATGRKLVVSAARLRGLWIGMCSTTVYKG